MENMHQCPKETNPNIWAAVRFCFKNNLNDDWLLKLFITYNLLIHKSIKHNIDTVLVTKYAWIVV